MDSRLSRRLIPGFIRKNDIRVEDYEEIPYESFNQFFCRKIKPGLRPIETDLDTLIAPCDGLLSVYPIREGTVLPIKESRYSIASLLRDDALAKEFDGGACLVFRLCVNHYHRYSYAESGTKGENRFLKGKLHTVRPIALEKSPVFTENCREYTVIETERFGKILQMEVGAMLVGKIDNYQKSVAAVTRGEEKGRFLYGGSTVILLLQRDRVDLRDGLADATLDGRETPVKLGERIGSVPIKDLCSANRFATT